MGKYPEREKRFEIRRLVESCESKIEVSELEKSLSQLAFLMNLHIQDDNTFQARINAIIGSSVTFNSLKSKTAHELTLLAKELHVKSGIVLFYMWRSWLLQKDLSAEFSNATATDPSDLEGEPRDDLEWDYLPQELQVKRQSMIEGFHELSRSLEILCEEILQSPSEASYALTREQGSPVATLLAAEQLLTQAQKRIVNIRKQIHNVYGFTDHHRPNKRFDKMAPRNIKAFYLWRKGDTGDDFTDPFLNSSISKSKARQAAQKAASRFEDNFVKFKEQLTELESNDAVPQVFYARHIGVAAAVGAREIIE